ncbi:MAG TPA: TetR family transcriptional regulator, partial [Streptosporangiaceae bacterium]|nr:TetR family transcriptional regulator [Streptosporangiaceae bacterium]
TQSGPQERRTYRSARRQQQAAQTRARICAAATGQFLAAGYAGTTVKAVAAAAGVSVPTVEAAFGTKARLLKAAIDVATAGDDAPVAMLDRSWAVRAEATPDPAGFVAEFAAVLTTSAQRAAGLILAALDASAYDPDIGAVAVQLAAQREVMAAWLVDGLRRRAALRPGLDRAEAVDTVWLLMDPAVFTRLTGARGWPPARFQAWFAAAVLRLLGQVAPGR